MFGSPCTVYRDPRKKNFSQQGMIVGIGEETKGYRLYLPKDKVVITTQHVRNIETLNKKQNENVQRLYLHDDTAEAEETAVDLGAGTSTEVRLRSRAVLKRQVKPRLVALASPAREQ